MVYVVGKKNVVRLNTLVLVAEVKLMNLLTVKFYSGVTGGVMKAFVVEGKIVFVILIVVWNMKWKG